MKRLAAALAALLLATPAWAQFQGPAAPYLGSAGGGSSSDSTNYIVSPGASADATAILATAFAGSASHPVYMACGTYNTTATVAVPHNGIIKSDLIWSYDTVGSFPNSVPCAVIKANNTSGNFTASGTAVVTMADYSSMSGVAVQGTNIAGQADALKITGRFVQARNNYLFNGNNGMVCDSPAIGMQFTSNLVGYNANDGMKITAGCPDHLITWNTFYSNSFIGASINATSKGTFTHNTVEWNGTNGCELFNSKYYVLSLNQIDRNSSAGCRFNNSGGQNVAITHVGNVYRRNGAGAVAGTDVHIIMDGTIDQFTSAGNTYIKDHINDDGTGIIAPNYIFFGTSPAFTNSQMSDQLTAQNTGIFEDATTTTAFNGIRLFGVGTANGVLRADGSGVVTAATTSGTGSTLLLGTGSTCVNCASNGVILDSYLTSTAQLDKTNDTALATITGLTTTTLVAGKTYVCRGHVTGTAGAAGGAKVAVTGGATATSASFTAQNYNGTTLNAQSTSTSLGSAIGAATAAMTDIYVTGAIVVANAGTLSLQFAQNVTDGTPSSALINSWFSCLRRN